LVESFYLRVPYGLVVSLCMCSVHCVSCFQADGGIFEVGWFKEAEI